MRRRPRFRMLTVALGMAASSFVTIGAGAAPATVPAISIDKVEVTEPLVGSRDAVFTVTLSSSSVDTVTVEYKTVDVSATAPDDYSAKSGTLRFDPGQVSRHVHVKVLADLLTEGTEKFKVVLHDPVGAVFADSKGTAKIDDPSQQQVAVPGAPLSNVVIDPTGTFAYATNQTLNEIEVLNIRRGTLGNPIFVGSMPQGIDITPDGSTLYVANSGAHNVSVVDVATREELRRITIPSGFANDRPFSIAIANNGKALLTTTFDGSGFGGQVYQIALATDEVALRTDIGSVTEDTRLASSLDHSTIGMIVGDVSSGAYNEYSADADHFGSGGGLFTFIDYLAMDGDGSIMLIDPGTYVISPDLELQGTIGGGGGAVAVQPNGLIAYRIRGTGLDVMDVNRFLTVRSIPIADQVAPRDEMAVTPDGSELVALTENGFTIATL